MWAHDTEEYVRRLNDAIGAMVDPRTGGTEFIIQLLKVCALLPVAARACGVTPRRASLSGVSDARCLALCCGAAAWKGQSAGLLERADEQVPGVRDGAC